MNAEIACHVMKGNPMAHVLNKMGKVVNGQRVYSKYNKDCQLFPELLEKYDSCPASP
ncbi:hypothetical protein F441_14674 [Phytophthora nicotianae CJ01A1]|uniref:Uncharacterized protein n=4 Tax=Phytophthora nicotianae TaxID=4792 RepID=V9EKV9_PHYNI|nr:hypothetical protein F443_14840 [Phytophthora nicotianae P1569]ETK79746.1 hypothetical protein L915_14419 [Phytophthora nicotianae]ETO68310.1 hypothetical protein F444_14835 [Phytophthora nicotianae P1976]ETP09462.1 hypothetical protein F441_14674 [Phytophthora nicotianae CJ01A1]